MKQTLRIAALGLFIASIAPLSVAECTSNRNANIQITKPDSQYTDHGDGTVTDNITGLMWQTCSLGQTYDAGACSGSASTMNWQAALTAANQNTAYGYDDWVLPNVTQLQSLVDHACFNPSINETLFPGTATGFYWSSSPWAKANNYAWDVDFRDGSDDVHTKNDGGRVRLVRASD